MKYKICFPTYVEFMKKFSEKNKDHIFLIPVADNKTMDLVQNYLMTLMLMLL